MDIVVVVVTVVVAIVVAVVLMVHGWQLVLYYISWIGWQKL